MKRPRMITKTIQGHRLRLKAGVWYVASLPWVHRTYCHPIHIAIHYKRRHKPDAAVKPVLVIHGVMPDKAAAFASAFNTSGPLGLSGRKWATR